MKERPVLMNGAMVRATLAGTKTHTRRIVKLTDTGRAKEVGSPRNWHLGDPDVIKACHYGQPGDRLWVRETFKAIASGEVKGGYGEVRYGFAYQADNATRWNERPTIINDMTDQPPTGPMQFNPVPWKPSIHMPRRASRITLGIVSVRVERLNEISEADAMMEGIESRAEYFRNYGLPESEGGGFNCPSNSFRSLWESINGPCSWAENPWVWVVEFRRLP